MRAVDEDSRVFCFYFSSSTYMSSDDDDSVTAKFFNTLERLHLWVSSFHMSSLTYSYIHKSVLHNACE